MPTIIRPRNAGVVWTSSNRKIATVNDKGKVKGIKIGKTKITVTTADGAKSATCTVNVVSNAIKLKSFSIKQKENTKLSKGKTLQVAPQQSPKNATGLIPTYKSSKEKIASIDKLGLITALKPGKTKITVTVGSKKKTFTLIVK